MIFPDVVWIAAGALTYLKAEKLLRLKGNTVLLFPDGNAAAFAHWRKEAKEARAQGMDVRLSTLIERSASHEDKKKGVDIADYLIRE